LALFPADPTYLYLLSRTAPSHPGLPGALLARAAAISLHPQFLYELGNAYLDGDEPAKACRAFRRTIAFLPGEFAVLANAAEALARDNRVEQAIPLHRRALAAKPDATLVLSNLAQAWTRLDHMTAAWRSARKALGLDPGLAAAHVNAGLALQGFDQQIDAEHCHRRALASDPESAEAKFALATSRLAKGDLKEGFRLYESRFGLREMRSAVGHWRVPAWDGSIRPGLRLMVWCEQGFGDSMHFIRYAVIAARSGIQVTVACPEPLRRLFGTLAPTIGICSLDNPPEVDAQVPLMSLPYLLGIAGDPVPAEVPYLHPVSSAPAEIVTARGPCVGLIWAGRPEYRGDRLRSMTPDVFRRLAETLIREDARLFSLQVGPRRDDLCDLASVIDLGGGFNDFADTAAAISALDLVIAVDSSVAHLSGALGCPTWLMLQHVAEWRWFKDRSDTPWYPTMRLFRQRTRGDWVSLVSEIGRAFQAWRRDWR